MTKLGEMESQSVYTVSFDVVLTTYNRSDESFKDTAKRGILKYKSDAVSNFAVMDGKGFDIRLCKEVNVKKHEGIYMDGKKHTWMTKIRAVFARIWKKKTS